MYTPPVPRPPVAMTVARLLSAGLFACLASACVSATHDTAPAAADTGVAFIVVRHGEKSNDDPRDPSLDDAGHARAARLAGRLSEHDIVGVYATGYRRTQQTLRPVADAHAVPIETYDARLPAEAFAAQLVAAHRAGTVLVAGHSNTVPQIVAALCACTAAEMPDDEYDRISIIRIDASGSRTLHVEQGDAASR